MEEIKQPLGQTPVPTPEPKKLKIDDKTLIIILGSALAVAMVVIIVLAVLLMNSGKDTPRQNIASETSKPETSESKETKNNSTSTESEADIEAQKLNDDIKGDVAAVVSALTSYQANNRGAIPTVSVVSKNDANKTNTWQYFIDKYLDTDATGNVSAEKFSDKYKIEACNYYEGTCKKPDSLTWAQDKYTIYIASKATCENGVVTMNQGARHVAVYVVKKPYSTMTNKYFCANN